MRKSANNLFYRLLLGGFILALEYCYANDVYDLEQFVIQLKQPTLSGAPPQLPSLTSGSRDYSLPAENNIFDAKRSINELGDAATQHYNLKQLQMVGYMNFAEVDYAFLKTPFETIKVRVGDNLQNGTVVKITAYRTEISHPEVDGDKTYIGKIYLELNSNTPQKLPQLLVK